MENSVNQLVLNKRLFEKAVSKAQVALKNGKLNSVITWAQIGAEFASSRHPGFYYSASLESILLEVAHRIGKQNESAVIDQKIRAQHTDTNKTHILHVMTAAYESGGHSRAVSGLVRNTSDTAVHSVVTTSQQDALPNDLFSSIVATGGWHQPLLTLSSNPLTRSYMLRHFSRNWADIVVLHVHPYDPLPIVAFGVEEGPPVILFNHADHLFWLGSSVADVVADLHPLGQKITLERRGVKNSRILPIPILKANPTTNHEVIRKQLGIKDDTIALLTVGSDYKYTPFAGYDFASTMVKILRRNSNTTLLAVGPSQQGRWAKASSLVDGRIKAVGVVDWSNLHAFYASADIYLEGFPLGSTTALLEAGLRDLPFIGMYIKEAPHLNASDDIALDKFDTHAQSLETFTNSLESMITKPFLYKQKVAQVKKSIETKHLPPRWNDFWDELLWSLPSEHTAKVPDSSKHPPDETDIFLAGFEATVPPGENAQNLFSNLVIYQVNHLSRNELIRNSAETLLKTNNLQMLGNSKAMFKCALRPKYDF